MHERSAVLHPAFRFALALALLPVWLLTAWAFCCTGSVLPRDTAAFSEDWHRIAGVLRSQARIVAGMALSPDGQAVAIVSHDDAVRVWDVATGQQRQVLSAPGKTLSLVAYSPDGHSVVAGGWGGAWCWDLAKGKELAALPIQGGPFDVRFTAAGKAIIAVYNVDASAIEFWELHTGQLLRVVHHPRPTFLLAAALSPDGRTLATAHANGAVRLLDARTGEELAEYAVPPEPYALTFSPDGGRLAVRHAAPTAVIRRTSGWSRQLDNWLDQTGLGVEIGTVVIDRATGAIWSGLPFSVRPVFTADGSALTTFGPDGVKSYDLPPRRRLFEPIAWVFLAAALVLSGVWWRGRRVGTCSPSLEW